MSRRLQTTYNIGHIILNLVLSYLLSSWRYPIFYALWFWVGPGWVFSRRLHRLDVARRSRPLIKDRARWMASPGTRHIILETRYEIIDGIYWIYFGPFFTAFSSGYCEAKGWVPFINIRIRIDCGYPLWTRVFSTPNWSGSRRKLDIADGLPKNLLLFLLHRKPYCDKMAKNGDLSRESIAQICNQSE